MSPQTHTEEVSIRRSLTPETSPAEQQVVEFPEGIVQTTQLRHQKHEAYLKDNDADLTVMLKLTNANSLVNQFDNPRSLLEPHHKVITSSAMHDDTLLNWPWDREAEVVKRFQPDFHLPGDRSIYRNMCIEKQKKALIKWAKGTRYITSELSNTDVTLIPIVKGWEEWHFEYCAQILKPLGYENCAFYASEYKNRITELETHVRRLVSVLQPRKVLTIGPQSKRHLERLPPEVVAAAGTRWRRKNEEDQVIHRDKVEQWKSARDPLLGSGQTSLGTFNSDNTLEVKS